MRVLSERIATPREIAVELDEPVNNVAYHIKVLLRLDCIELVKTKQVRGGRVAEHFYKATQRHQMWDTAAWEQLGEAEQLDVTSAIMQQIAEDIANAMASGTFYEDADNHLSRLPMTLDEDGWGEVISLLDGTLDELIAIQERVKARTDGPNERPHRAKVEIIHFRSPPPKSG